MLCRTMRNICKIMINCSQCFQLSETNRYGPDKCCHCRAHTTAADRGSLHKSAEMLRIKHLTCGPHRHWRAAHQRPFHFIFISLLCYSMLSWAAMSNLKNAVSAGAGARSVDLPSNVAWEGKGFYETDYLIPSCYRTLRRNTIAVIVYTLPCCGAFFRLFPPSICGAHDILGPDVPRTLSCFVIAYYWFLQLWASPTEVSWRVSGFMWCRRVAIYQAKKSGHQLEAAVQYLYLLLP